MYYYKINLKYKLWNNPELGLSCDKRSSEEQIKITTKSMSERLFRSKNFERSFVSIPIHGSVAWYWENGQWTEFIYWKSTRYEEGWVTSNEFRCRKYAIKKDHIAFFSSHPHLLAEKIRNKRGIDRFLWTYRPPFTMEKPSACECSGPAFCGSSD